MFEFDNDENLVYALLLKLYKIVCKIEPKRNTMLVVGPPNSCKKYFFNCKQFIHV